MTEKLNMQAFVGIICAPFLLLAPVYSAKLLSTKNQEAVI